MIIASLMISVIIAACEIATSIESEHLRNKQVRTALRYLRYIAGGGMGVTCLVIGLTQYPNTQAGIVDLLSIHDNWRRVYILTFAASMCPMAFIALSNARKSR